MVNQESIFISVEEVPKVSDKLHIRRIWKNPMGAPVLMIHGAVENGQIFYTDSGKGLGPYLAEQGFDVYVGDLRGRGKSVPPLSRYSEFGQNESINQEIPAMISYIHRNRGPVPQKWIGHSWGGVLLLSVFARHEVFRPLVQDMVFFGTKRSVRAKNLEVFFKLNFFWNRVAPQMAKIFGYLPAKKLGIGSDNETLWSHRESMEWVQSESWVDVRDQFDYGQILQQLTLPRLLFLAGKNDKALGHIDDIRRLMAEINAEKSQLWSLGKGSGFLNDYGHIDMLTHSKAPEDHFPKVAQWLLQGAHN